MASSQPRRALISVSDARGLAFVAQTLAKGCGFELIATSGTAAKLRSILKVADTVDSESKAGAVVRDVSSLTGIPELIGGRVKTLHPAVHGGILAQRNKPEDVAELAAHGIGLIDVVICNLYPFAAAVEDAVGRLGDAEADADCIENIDIGGVTLIRAAAKNFAHVAVLTDIAQYEDFCREAEATFAQEQEERASREGIAAVQERTLVSLETRRNLARAAFKHTAAYDTAICDWMTSGASAASHGNDTAVAADALPSVAPDSVSVSLTKKMALKYGLNPHHQPAAVYTRDGVALPFSVRSGVPGFINILDALNAWQLVCEARDALAERGFTTVVAASFKHVSPAGTAVSGEVQEHIKQQYKAVKEWTPTVSAYVRARQVDPKCSFGDFVAISGMVDVATATALKSDVSDGIIAQGYEAEALAILRTKKGGTYVVLEAASRSSLPQSSAILELREVSGVICASSRPYVPAIGTGGTQKVVTTAKTIPELAWVDLVLAAVTTRYTQSNSVVFARQGQVIGVGAGQQSRVDCVRLAGKKAEIWYLRNHPRVLNLAFKKGLKSADRVNASTAFIEGDLTPAEYDAWLQNFESGQAPEPLSAEERAVWLGGLTGVSVVSDAFFPFRDSIDQASKRGVQYVMQPGGSKGDDSCIAAADGYGMAMIFTGTRLFHH